MFDCVQRDQDRCSAVLATLHGGYPRACVYLRSVDNPCLCMPRGRPWHQCSRASVIPRLVGIHCAQQHFLCGDRQQAFGTICHASVTGVMLCVHRLAACHLTGAAENSLESLVLSCLGALSRAQVVQQLSTVVELY